MPEEKKSRYKGYTQAQNRATQKYAKANLEQVRFSVRKGIKSRYQDAAAAAGLSLSMFMQAAAEEKIKRDKLDK